VQVKGCLADCTTKIVIEQGWHTTEIARRYDCAVFFAHAKWSGNTVAVFIDGTYCGTVKVAYDLASGHVITFDAVAADLQASIIHDYNVSADELRAHGGDVFKWATYPGTCCSRGSDEFRKRYPLFKH